MNKARLIATVLSGGGTPAPTVTRLLDDQFTDVVAAGAVNGTTATPGGQTRGAVDTGSKMDIPSGRLRMFTPTSIGNDPRIYYGPFTRAQGLAFAFDVFCPSLADALLFGWMNSTGTGTSRFVHSLYVQSVGGNTVKFFNGTTETAINNDLAVNTVRKFVLILRSTGCYMVQYAADLATCNLIYIHTAGTTATLYAGGANRVNGAYTQFDNLSIGQLGGGWLADAYSGASVPLAITGTDKLWLDALFS